MLLVFGVPLYRILEGLAQRQARLNADLQSLVKSDFQHFHDSLEQSSSDETDNCIAVIAKRLETDHVMKKQFTRIIPPELLDAMFKRGEIQLGGERVRGALLFLDIRGFTAIAQRRDPEQVVDILNKFFSRAVPVIERSGGIVDKFVGDGLLALFGIPKSLGNNALCAIQAAIELQDLTKTLNEEKLYGDDIQVDVGIGVAKGNVIAGTIGSPTRLNYTAVGATVNLAARLCSVAKRGEIVCCNFTHLDVQPFAYTERTAPIMLKGIDVPIYTYRVQGWIKGTPSSRYFAVQENVTKVVPRPETARLESVDKLNSKELASRITRHIPDEVKRKSEATQKQTPSDRGPTEEIFVAPKGKATRELADLVAEASASPNPLSAGDVTERQSHSGSNSTSHAHSGGVMSAIGRKDSGRYKTMSSEQMAQLGHKESERRQQSERVKQESTRSRKVEPDGGQDAANASSDGESKAKA